MREKKKSIFVGNFRKFLSEEEIHELREGLKHKWDEINREYQKMAHIRIIDTQGLRTKKLKY